MGADDTQPDSRYLLALVVRLKCYQRLGLPRWPRRSRRR